MRPPDPSGLAHHQEEALTAGSPHVPSEAQTRLSGSFRSVCTAQRRGGSPETRPSPDTQLTPGGGPRWLLEELGHVQARNHDILEDGHVVWTRLGRALLQRLDDGLLHVPAGVPPHGQQRADVLVPGGGRGRQGAAAATQPPKPTQAPRPPTGRQGSWRFTKAGGEPAPGSRSPRFLPPHAGGARLRSLVPPTRGTGSASRNQSARPPSHRRPSTNCGLVTPGNRDPRWGWRAPLSSLKPTLPASPSARHLGSSLEPGPATLTREAPT